MVLDSILSLWKIHLTATCIVLALNLKIGFLDLLKYSNQNRLGVICMQIQRFYATGNQ